MDIILRPEQMEKVKRMLFDTFEERLSPSKGWDAVANDIRKDSVKSQYRGETFIHTDFDDDHYYNYYSCEYIKFMGLENTECPCLMLQDDDYGYFNRVFPSSLWKPLLVEWWNENCEYPVKAVYEFE